MRVLALLLRRRQCQRLGQCLGVSPLARLGEAVARLGMRARLAREEAKPRGEPRLEHSPTGRCRLRQEGGIAYKPVNNKGTLQSS